MWSRPLRRWYAAHGRHDLPWRNTRDPWAVLVSEVMLQQTSVARVRPRWEAFMTRWPAPGDLAADPLDELLRFWQGLGYPRRARRLWLCACQISAEGWPGDEAGLRRLPGVGRYTARALRVLAWDAPDAPIPGDVNIARVASRAGLGRDTATDRELDAVLSRARPARMSPRDFTLALFDVGALHCRAQPRCDVCPLRSGCTMRRQPQPRATTRRQPAYAGSMRQLRGAVLRELLAAPELDSAALRLRLAAMPQLGDPSALDAAVAGLLRDGLIAAPPR